MNQTINLLTKIEEYNEVELLRRQVLHYVNLDTSRYVNDLSNKEIYSYATRIDDEIVAGCYFCVNYTSLNIKQLFVKESYQNTGARLGRKLLLYLFDNKQSIETLTGKIINESMIYPVSDKSLALYKSIGYENIEYDYSLMIKKL